MRPENYGQHARLQQMAALEEQYPKDELPEIALVGRSNVGKSTFINRFLGRKNLAHTSSNPGKTRTVNFYDVNGCWRLVDLPGYGYAKASKTEQEAWSERIRHYLSTRENLVDVFLLCDLRHPPTALDRQMFDWLKEAGFTGTVIGTKADKIPRTKRAHHLKEVRQELGAALERVFLYSGAEGLGLDAIWEHVVSLLGEPTMLGC